MVGWKMLLIICYRNISFQKERQANHLWQDQPHREDSFRQINATWCTNLISLGIFVPDLFDQTCVFLLTQCPLSGLVKASGSNGNHQGRYASLLCTFPSINAIAVLIQKVKVGNNINSTLKHLSSHKAIPLPSDCSSESAGTLIIGQTEKW